MGHQSGPPDRPISHPGLLPIPLLIPKSLRARILSALLLTGWQVWCGLRLENIRKNLESGL